MSRMRLPVASELAQGRVDPLGLGRATEPWKTPTLPRRAAPQPNPMRQTRPLARSPAGVVTASREVCWGLPCPSVETYAWVVWGVAAVVPSVRD